MYDPADISEITIEWEGHTPCTARELEIGERAGQRPALPNHLLLEEAEESRLLRGAEKQQTQRQLDQIPAISYRAVRKGADEHV